MITEEMLEKILARDDLTFKETPPEYEYDSLHSVEETEELVQSIIERRNEPVIEQKL